MMTSDDKVGGWVKKVQNHDDVKEKKNCKWEPPNRGTWCSLKRINSLCIPSISCVSALYVLLRIDTLLYACPA